jgi:cytochrome c551/c552
MIRLVSATICTALFVILAGMGPGIAAAANGKSVFDSLRCTTCHKPDQRSTGVALADIAKAYPDPQQLIKFFSGESKPVIETEKPGMMRGQMPRLQALSDEDKQALADYIFSVK